MSASNSNIDTLPKVAAKPAARPPPVILDGAGIIKYVNSASSVTVMGVPRSGPPPEIVVFFEGIDTPRFRKGQDIDPQAYYLREILRNFCIGKACHYHTTQDLPSLPGEVQTQKRRFGTVMLDEGSVNLTEWVLSQGLATVRQQRGPTDRLPKTVQDQLASLQKFEEEARAAARGLHAPSMTLVAESKEPLDLHQFIKDNKGKEVPIVIDFVTSGSSMRGYVQYKNMLYSLPFQLSHVLCPSFTRSEDPSHPAERIAQPFAEEAKFFVEKEILHRNVVIIPEAIERDRLSVRLMAPKGDLGAVLLRFGFARIVGLPQGTATTQTDAPSDLSEAVQVQYRAEQDSARENHYRIWKDWVAPPPRVEREKPQPPECKVLDHFYALVTEVVSGDTLVVAPVDIEDEETKNILSTLHVKLPQATSEVKEEEEKEEAEEPKQEIVGSVVADTKKPQKQAKKPKKGEFVPPPAFEPDTKEKDKKKKAPKPKQQQQQHKSPQALTVHDGVQLVELAKVVKEERRISLASIQAPRLTIRNTQRGASSFATATTAADIARLNPAQPPYAWEAREQLRKMLLGRIVAVDVEYTRPFPQGSEQFSAPGAQTDRDFASVTLENENINVFMVREGLARPLRHRVEESRSAVYPQILQAEEVATKQKKRLFQFDHELTPFVPGMAPLKPGERRKPYSAMTEEERAEADQERNLRFKDERDKRDAERKEVLKKVAEKAPIVRYNDISFDPKLNRQFLSTFLSRSATSTLRGFVENIMNPTRFMIVVPRHSLIISFVLERLRAPQRAPRRFPAAGEGAAAASTAAAEAHPYAEEALKQARLMLLNRDVEFVVSRLETSGRSWIGSLVLDGQDIAERLLEAGLCWISVRDEREATPNLVQAQEKAQSAKRGIWQFPDPMMGAERMDRRRGAKGGEEEGEQEEDEEGLEESPAPSDDERRSKKPGQKKGKTAGPTGAKEGETTKCRVLDIIDSGAVVVQVGVPPDEKLNKRCAEILALPAEDPLRKKLMPFSKALLPGVGTDVAVCVDVNGAGVVQTGLKKQGKKKKGAIRREWRRAHVEAIEQAGTEGVAESVLCLSLLDTMVPVTIPLEAAATDVMCMEEDLLEISGCAFNAFLAFVRPIPGQDEITTEAIEMMRQLLLNKELELSTEWTDRSNRPYIVLTLPNAAPQATSPAATPAAAATASASASPSAAKPTTPQNLNVNLEILRRGLVVTDEESVPIYKRRMLKDYEEAEAEARSKHLGGWKHGDFRSEEEVEAMERRKRREKTRRS